MEITTPGLASINDGLNTAFNTQLYSAKTVFREFTYEASSTGPEEIYPGLDLLPGVREWIGARVANGLSIHTYTIQNRKFEQTIRIKRDDIEDDKYGLYTPIAGEMGRAGAEFPELLIARLMKMGTTVAVYDGQNMFDPAHPTYAPITGAPTTVANYFPGSPGNIGPGWYMVDNSRVLKPFVLQTRVPFTVSARLEPSDPSVFDNDEFLWGSRARMNAGFGLWQLAAYSTLPMTIANMQAVRNAMATICRPDGTPMGIKMDSVIVPTTLIDQANSYYKNQLVANNPATPTTLVENVIIGDFKPIEFKWLN